MKKTITLVLITLLAVSAASVSFAADATSTVPQTPAQVVSNLSGQPLEDILNLKMSSGKTYGTIAKELGVLDAFKASSLESKADILKAQAALGKITQEEADKLITALTDAQAACDGSGSTSIGKNANAGFGLGQGSKNRNTAGIVQDGQNSGRGFGNKQGGGRNSQNGTRVHRNRTTPQAPQSGN